MIESAGSFLTAGVRFLKSAPCELFAGQRTGSMYFFPTKNVTAGAAFDICKGRLA